MNRTLLTHGCLVLAIVAVGWPMRQVTVGQATEADEEQTVSLGEGSPPRVAVVDVKRIFQDDGDFKNAMEKLRGDVEAYQKEAVVRQTEITSLQQKLKAMKPGSPERDKAQLLLARLQTELKLTNERRQQELVRREAALYGDTYTKITAAVSRYAKAHRIGLVVRSDQQEIDPSNSKSVLGAVNRIVVYQDNLDITEAILKELNSSEI
jgi:Skp family chaperone for outer membrane proteins